MLIYIVRGEETIPVTRFFDTRNTFKGGKLSCILNLTVLNGRHWEFDCFKRSQLEVLCAYMSMCTVNKI